MNYVPRFLAVAEIVANPSQFGVYLPAIANRQHFRSVPANYGVSLAEVSQLTGVSYDELERLNTALTSGRIDASGPQRVIIPNDVDVNIDAKLSALRGNGSSNVIASSTPATPSTSGSTSYNNKPYSSGSLPSTGSGLAEYAASASVPQQTTSYISPAATPSSSSVYSSNNNARTEPPITSSETQKINAELKSSNSLPTTSAQITGNNTIVQEPPLSQEERDFIARQIQSQTPDQREVVSAVDGNIKLSAVQTQQSVLEASGREKKLSFATSANSKAKPQGKRSTYTVKRGDTLSNIASRAGVSWREIAEWNQIDPKANLLSGSTLYLYNAKPIEPLKSSNTPAQPESYVVQSGDTLIGTANRFGLSVTQLATYNNLSSRADLLRGQKLWLVPGKVTAPAVTPAAPSRKRAQSTTATKSYKVQSGDGLIALAKQFGISTQALADLNGIGSTDSLYVGQTLKIPADANTTSSSNSSASRSSSSAVTSNYKVKSGETLIGIANSLGVSAAQVAAVNSSFDERARLQRGQTIKVPVSASQVDNKLNDKPISYKIRSGDTLIGVANRYKIGVSDLAAANNLSTNSNLILGRSLTIPAAGNRSTATSATSTSSAASTSTASTGKKLDNTENYKIQSGDGLIALARRFGVSVSDLAATNNLSTKAQLQRGQTLKVPKMTVSYQVASGDSLIGLARKYGVSTKELADMNDIAPDTMLQRGQRLTVPNR